MGIEWLDLNPSTPTVATVAQAQYTENTLYNPVQGVGVMFDITPEKLEVAAGFDFEGFNLIDQGMIAPPARIQSPRTLPLTTITSLALLMPKATPKMQIMMATPSHSSPMKWRFSLA